MKNVFLVSYPRSGQHYMQRMIERVTGVDDYCEFYSCRIDCPGKGRPPNDRIPCPAGCKIQKNHDFQLDLKVDPNWKYAVFIRNPLSSMMSYYERETNAAGTVPNWDSDGRRVRVEDSERAWVNFIENRAQYWAKFVKKWMSFETENVRVYKYEDLIQDELKFLDFFSFAFEVDHSQKAQDLIRKQASQVDITSPRPVRKTIEFKYDKVPSRKILKEVIGEPALIMAGYWL